MIDEKRFEISFTRGSGPGGQHRNKVESCVIAKDPITGMTERCCATPSQHTNKKIAIDRLTARVIIEKDGIEAKVRNLQRIKSKSTGIIRTYNYARNEVKNHKTGNKANLRKVLDGNLDLIK